MANNRGTKVDIFVPMGLNGWQYSGRVRINGREYVFPVGKKTQVPEPVAVLLQKMIDEEAMLETIKAKNQHHKPNQAYVTDPSGNPVWEDRTHGGERVTIEWDGVCDKTTTTPGTGSTTQMNGICRYWKISDRIPSKAELYAEDVEVVFSGKKAENVIDGTVEGDGYYGRWTLPGMPPQAGEYPCVLVVTKPAKISTVGYNCWEPGIYALAAALGSNLAVQSLTYGWFKQLDKMYIPDGVGGVQPDWNQNDPAAADYVKNRTHYSEVGMVVLGEAKDVNFATAGEPIDAPFSFDLSAGVTYEVVWDGVEYECVSYTVEGLNLLAIGNAAMAGAAGGNGEPFFITTLEGKIVVGAQETGTHTFSVKTMKEIAHALDPKYVGYDCVITGNEDINSINSLSQFRIASGGVQNVLAAYNAGAMPRACFLYSNAYSGYMHEAFSIEVEPSHNRFQVKIPYYQGAGQIDVYELTVTDDGVVNALKNSNSYLT